MDLSKEVIMAHSAYARAAGLQSEVNKITVTRVAGNEVEYKRQLNLYRKDMMIKINNIRREEKRLKKSMIRYHMKRRQNQIDKRKREKDDEERVRKAMENITNVIQVNVTPEVHTREQSDLKEGTPDSGLGEDIDQEKNCSDIAMDKSNGDCLVQHTNLAKDGTGTGSKNIHLPVIQEDTEEQENGAENDLEINEDEMSSQSKESDEGHLSSKNESVSLPTMPSALLRLQNKPLKTKKQVVSFADLIKLQHSTNTKKLFNLVHLLAEKHGVKDETTKEAKENRNSVVFRRSTDEVMSDSIMRTASVLYPMKFGYMGSSELPPLEKSNLILSSLDSNSTQNSGEATPEQKSSRSPTLHISQFEPNSSRARNYSRQTEPCKSTGLNETSSSSPRYLKKRINSMPAIVAEVERIQKENLQKVTAEANKDKIEKIVSKSVPPAPRLLRPLEKRLSTGEISPPRSDRVSWTEAFGLLKVVHALQDIY